MSEGKVGWTWQEFVLAKVEDELAKLAKAGRTFAHNVVPGEGWMVPMSVVSQQERKMQYV
jgi:hypothetical protein